MKCKTLFARKIFFGCECSRCRGDLSVEGPRAALPAPQKPLQHAGSRHSSLPAGVHPQSPASQPPAAAAGFSNVSNALAACLSTAPARQVVHQPLIEQQVTLCRLAAAAARRSAAAACIEWCLQTTQPAASEGRGSSDPGRMPKERPPRRSGRGRERRVHESSYRALQELCDAKFLGGATPADKPTRVIQAGYRPGARARMPPGAPKANPSPYEPLASDPRRGTLLGGCREQPVVQGRRMRLYRRVARPAPVPHVRWTRPDAKQARRGA